MLYVSEHFEPEEIEVLRRYFTNLDGPVFALVNLPEVVKGALFARYSRSPKSLRRLFLDEFVGELDISGDESLDATIGLQRAEELYERVFFEYGDDSVAQLGGVHLACEQASNILTKVLEWGRLMSYLEQSTRYIAYDERLGGRYRYWRDPSIGHSPLGARYVADMDAMFDAYADMMPIMLRWAKERYPRDPSDNEMVYQSTIKAKACDALRGLLPASTLSNVGIYGTGQGYEQLLLRMRSHPLHEVRSYADLMLIELRKTIPSFLTRIDRPDRGGRWSQYFADNRRAIEETANTLMAVLPDPVQDESVRLVDFDPEGEQKVVAAALFSSTSASEAQIAQAVSQLSREERSAILLAYVGDRTNRRHRPGRAFERTDYRFEIATDYGAFRDLQRHRMLTIEWQRLSPNLGYDVPESVSEAGLESRYRSVMERSRDLYEAISGAFPEEAQYAVALGFRIRFVMQMNAREAMHVTELRTTPQGHPSYRAVCQKMHQLIRDEAGHVAIADAMNFVDHGVYELERLASERQAHQRRVGR
ncbi:MAG: FAD-dependent thymidylate synthase [Actinobacteria bacterium]|nr:FAD-dependent thymidylate synthase [Actinomycetota bacterium]MCB9388736.1 FAD-dependent thymidylate synthase [Acidimicrobiia bacterium]